MIIDETLSDPNSTLAILGVANKESLSAKALIEAARSLAPQAWQPTSDVLRITINRALGLKYLRQAQNNLMAADAPLEITRLGRQRLDGLMAAEPVKISCHAIFITITLQSFFMNEQTYPDRAEVTATKQGRDDDYLFY